MSLPVVVQGKETVFFDRAYARVALSQNTNLTLITSQRCRTGLQPYLTIYAQQIDAGGNAYVTWHLYRNGQPWYPFHSHTDQVGSPFDQSRLPVAMRAEQGDLLEIYADLGAAGAGTFNALGLLVVEYFDLGGF